MIGALTKEVVDAIIMNRPFLSSCEQCLLYGVLVQWVMRASELFNQ